PATQKYALPHQYCNGTITLVHNGIIENVQELREYLAAQGSCPLTDHYVSDTDSEVVAHLIGHFKKSFPFREAVEQALKRLRGSYAFLIIDKATPDTLIAVRLGSPLLLGVRSAHATQHDIAIVSSAEPLANHGYSQVRALEDGDLVEIKAGRYPESVRFYQQGLPQATPGLDRLDVKAAYADKGQSATFLEKEIREQPEVAETVIHSHYTETEARLGGFAAWTSDELKKIQRVWLIAEGTSLRAAEVGAEWFRRYAKLDATTQLASEFALNPGRLDPLHSLYIVLSQSGETADVRVAAEEIVRQGGKLFGLVNVVGSSIARLVGTHGGGMYTHAGPEISVASTKVFTAQLSQLAVLTILFSRNVHGTMSPLEAERWIQEHRKIPQLIKQTLSCWDTVARVAQELQGATRGVLYIGRGTSLALAREGALKLLELSYLNAVAYSAGEMKHGMIALIDPDFPTIAVAPADDYYSKTVGNVHEIKARNGKVFAIVTQGDTELFRLADKVIEIPKTHEAFYPILAAIPLQILAHEAARLRGCAIDKPRNLAKSVTVQ
ncbi:MAG: glutamine--fructose-6-phosphate transaminase (isomerizing), partial [bacterium]|nr:glutamine--fructose-6-phosphate transaminase (isomerizing) [bacterium]